MDLKGPARAKRKPPRAALTPHPSPEGIWEILAGRSHPESLSQMERGETERLLFLSSSFRFPHSGLHAIPRFPHSVPLSPTVTPK